MGIIQSAINQMIGTVGISAGLISKQKKQADIKKEEKIAEEAYTTAEKKLAESESTLHSRSGHKQYQEVLDLNKEAQSLLKRTGLSSEKEKRLSELVKKEEEFELRRKKALERVAKSQESKRKQREESQKFFELFTQGGLYK